MKTDQKKFRFKADCVLYATDIDDAINQLANHFVAMNLDGLGVISDDGVFTAPSSISIKPDKRK
jgi:hypothetical protein